MWNYCCTEIDKTLLFYKHAVAVIGETLTWPCK